MMIRRLLYLILAILTASLLLIGSGQRAALFSTSSCYGRGVVVAQITNPQPQVTGDRPMKSFTLLEMPNHWQKLVGFDQNGRCFDYVERQTNYVTLSAFLPIELATDLVAQRWSNLSTTAVESLIAASTHNPDTWLAPEDALALHRLSYQIPAMAKVLPTLSPYQFLEQAHGKETARAILSGCNSKFIFNPGEYESAKYFSDYLGDEEIRYKQRS